MSSQMLMGYALSVVSPDTKYPAFSADAFAKAAEVAILGMAMVFAVLALLWGVLAIFKMIFARNQKKPTEPPKPAEAPVAQEPLPEAAYDGGELIAVLTAAIEAYRSDEEGLDSTAAGGFRVVSFKRAAGGRPWNSK